MFYGVSEKRPTRKTIKSEKPLSPARGGSKATRVTPRPRGATKEGKLGLRNGPTFKGKEKAVMKSPTVLRLSTLPAGSRVCLGIDLSTKSWHVTARCAGETVFAASMPPSVTSLGPLLSSLRGRPVRSVYEAGPFGFGLHDWLHGKGVDSMIVAPAFVPSQAGNRVKTDRRDSLKLATTLEAGLLRPIYVPDAEHRAYRELVRQRLRLQKCRRSSMQRIKSFLLTYGIPLPSCRHWRDAFDEWLRQLHLEDPYLQKTLVAARDLYVDLDRRVRALDVELRRLARSAPFRDSVKLLTSVPGIGTLTALVISAEVVDWSRFPDGETFSAYVGLTPSQYSSGTLVHFGRITRMGNATLRSLLVESSWCLIRKDPEMRAFFDRLRLRCGAKRAIVAVARKLCHRLVRMAHRKELYRPAPIKTRALVSPGPSRAEGTASRPLRPRALP